MLWAAVGILIGIIMGLNLNFDIPIEYTKYTAIVIVGILDALFGAIRAETTEEEYSPSIFITGLITNIVLAIGITILGEKLGLELYLAAAVVFTFRIFSNIGKIRRELLKKYRRKSWKHFL